MDYGFEVDFLGGKQRETLTEVDAHLITEYALCARTCTVTLHCAISTYMAEQF